MNSDQLLMLAHGVLTNGPDRVVINRAGDATTSRRAREEYQITPDVIFLRRDGWSLGAPTWLQSMAENMWRNEWVGVIRRPSTTPEPYPAVVAEGPGARR